MAKRDFVLNNSVMDERGDQYASVVLTPNEDRSEKIVLAKPFVIPVLFLPGIMGTNLRKKKDKEVAWRPPNQDMRGAADLIWQLLCYVLKNARERAEDLVTDSVEIDPRGPIDAGESGVPENVLVARGWGALLRSSYHPFMAQLEKLLNSLSVYDFEREEAVLQNWAAEHGHQPPTEWGADGGEALTREEILHAANYQFDVWAGGYNWLQSNRDSGKAIQELIEKTILPFYNQGERVVVEDTPDGDGNDRRYIRRAKPNRPLAKKVIVVTHSMGGLVSRALTEIHHCEHVLGVSHGVQPATGAPATYKRMRAGFEGAEQLFLGRNAAEVTGVLSQAPGGLELLPTADYNDGKPWLLVREKGHGKKVILHLPQKKDPYREIYCSPEWYGLVPEANLGLTDLAKKDSSSQSKEASPSVEGKERTSRQQLTMAIKKVRTFHEDIQGKYKKPTYVHYGAQGMRNTESDLGGLFGSGLLATQHRNAWGEIAWEGRGVGALDVKQIKITRDDGNGRLRTSGGIELTLSEPDCPGDGTVPIFSGAAPAKTADVALCFAHGHGNPGQQNAHFGYDHQNSYVEEHRRSLYATMYAIIKFAQQANWHTKVSV